MRRVCLVAAAVALLAAALAGGRAGTRTLPLPGSPEEVSLASAPRAAPTAVRRAAAWCGTTSTTDRPAATTGYQIHVYYAMPADGGDNSATFAPQISDWLDQMDAWWQREDPSRLPRLDVYQAPCGPQIDLQVLRVPTISVAMTDGSQLLDLIWNQLNIQPDATTSKYLVFLDDVDTGDLCGVGTRATDAALGSPAMGLATVFLDSCEGADRVTIAAHELLHAVSPASRLQGAPHTCPNDDAHVCDSSGDVLYPYVEAGVPISSLQLDFGHDDYWAGTAPVNLQVQPWFEHTQDRAQLALTIAGKGTVQSDLPGLDCSSSCATDWDRGTAVQLSPASGDGYRFVRWSGGCSGDADCSLTVDGPKDVTALFAPATYPLSVRVTGSGRVTSLPGGIACRRGTCTRRFSSYERVVLAAKPAKGWRLVAWSGACHGKTRCSVRMTVATTVRASFARRR